MKTKKKDLWAPADEVGFKKRFLTRIIEEKEADDEINKFCTERSAASSQMPSPQGLDAERTVRNVSS